MYKNYNVVAVIPARGGSKGVKLKNLRKVNGRSLTELAVRAAKKSIYVDEIIISSDDQRIINEAERFGAKSLSLRPSSLSKDNSLSADVWRYEWNQAEVSLKKKFEISVLLEPTCPTRIAIDIDSSIEMLFSKSAGIIVTVSRNPAHFSPQKVIVLDDKCNFQFYHSQGVNHSLRQTIPEYFHRNGSCYASNRTHMIEKNLFLEQDAKALIIDRLMVNVDTEEDLIYANYLIKKQNFIE